MFLLVVRMKFIRSNMQLKVQERTSKWIKICFHKLKLKDLQSIQFGATFCCHSNCLSTKFQGGEKLTPEHQTQKIGTSDKVHKIGWCMIVHETYTHHGGNVQVCRLLCVW